MATRHTIHGREYRDLDAIRDRIAQLDAAHPGRRFPKAVADEFESLDAALREAEQEARRSRVMEAARSASRREEGANFRASDEQPRTGTGGADRHYRDAIRALERSVDRGDLTTSDADRVVDVLDRDRALGIDAQYVAAVGDPAYERAFSALLRYGPMAPMRMTAEEQQAVQRVTAAEQQRALVEGTGSAGGYAVPISVDPTIRLSSNGAVNPIRALATVRQMTTRELRLVTSDGVTATYAPEATEVGDNSPTLAQPTLVAAKAHAFVPFSFELGDDWNGIRADLTRLISDAKDVLEATAFLTGDGSDEPQGLLSGLSTTQRVQTAGTAAFAIADSYSLAAALPPRFQPNATLAAAPATLDVIYRQVGGGSSEPAVLTEDGRWLRRPVAAWSTMATGTTSGTKIAVLGDFREYVIGDRLGLSVEIVQHLFGANRRPTGQRGLYAYWRNDGRVAVPHAFRYLEVK
jgi:HK97 family phage major capsid protein